MIKTNLKKILAKSSKSQTAIAKELGIAPSRFSDVVNGRAFLDDDEFMKLCVYFKARPEDVYDADTLGVVYGSVPKKRDKAPSSVQIRVSSLNAEYLDILVENGVYENRCEALNGILNQKRRVGNGWQDDELGELE